MDRWGGVGDLVSVVSVPKEEDKEEEQKRMAAVASEAQILFL